MNITAWRIVKARHAARAFDGEGARIEGGRWNSPGTPMVYTSGSVALAALEMLVHLGRFTMLSEYVAISCTFESALVSRIDRRAPPKHWRSYPAPPELQQLGDEWIANATSAVLEVPSAVIETDVNYLFNPRHADVSAIRTGRPGRFEFDLRLLMP